MRRVGISIGVAIAGVTSLVAQERIPAGPPADGPRFEVASIKRVTDAERRGASVGERPGGRWLLSNMAIAPMIRTAYPSDTSDLINAPPWVLQERYDVDARAAGEVPREQMAPMLQALLAQRFNLAVHYEIQERPIYALVLARPDGRPGPGLQRSTLDCEAIQAQRRKAPAEPIPPAANGAPACGMSMQASTFMTISVGGQPLSRLADSISGNAGRKVVDRTGLSGNWDVTLRFSGERTGAEPAADAPPALFTALQEQLGLKLEADRAPLRVLVVDRVERPTED